MLPDRPLSEISEEEILAELRSIRVKRVAAKERASKPRGSRKIANDMALSNLYDQLNALLNEPTPEETDAQT
jgi:hypothetical protein